MSVSRLMCLFIVLMFITIPVSGISRKDAERLVNSTVKVTNSHGGGSGFLLKYHNRNYVITAGHVCGKSKTMTVSTIKGIVFETTVLKSTHIPDMCVLTSVVQGLVELTNLPDDQCDWMAVKVGYPKLGSMRIQSNMLCESVFFEDAIPGESGGPVFDRTLRITGLTIGVFHVGKNIYTWVLPISKIRRLMESIK